jgi:hypothetical protein
LPAYSSRTLAFLQLPTYRARRIEDCPPRISLKLSFIEIADLPLFPFEDGVLRAINENSVFLHRNASERELFKETPETNLDIGKVSAGFLERLREFAVNSATSSLRFRNPQDLHNYCSKTVFRSQNKSLDMIDGDQRIRSFVDHVWKWMASFDLNLPTLTAIGPVWLLPLTNGKYRKIQPQSSSLTVTYTVIKKTKKIMQRIAVLEPSSSPLMLDSDAIPGQLSMIGQIASKKPEFAIRNADVFIPFLEWLVEGRHLLEQANPAEKEHVLDATVNWFWGCKNHDKLAKQLLRQLCVFKQVRRSKVAGKM